MNTNELDVQQFSLTSRTQQYMDGVARDLRFVLTQACNYNCGFCHKEWLTGKEKNAFIADDYQFMYDTGSMYIPLKGATLTWGEPLIRKDIGQIAQKLKESWAYVTVVTNWSLLDKKYKAIQYMDRVNISMHALQQQPYHQITNSAYTVDDILANIELLRQSYPNLHIRLNATLMDGLNTSEQDIDQMITTAENQNLSIKYVELYPKNTEWYVDLLFVEEILKAKWFEKQSEQGRQIQYQKGKVVVILTRIFCSNAELSKNPQSYCKAYNDVYISPDWTMSVCPNDPKKIDIYDIVKDRDEAWFGYILQQSVSNVQYNCHLRK